MRPSNNFYEHPNLASNGGFKGEGATRIVRLRFLKHQHLLPVGTKNEDVINGVTYGVPIIGQNFNGLDRGYFTPASGVLWALIGMTGDVAHFLPIFHSHDGFMGRTVHLPTNLPYKSTIHVVFI